MKSRWIQKNVSDKLIIFFGGFACDENLLKNSKIERFDVLMFFDYSNFGFDFEESLEAYDEIYHIAWSFGIWAADLVKDRLPPAKMRIALCGSPYPVDNEKGIPTSIFDGTVRNFDDKNREKFLARVFGVRNFEKSRPLFASRNAAEEKGELESMAEAFKTFKADPDNWTRAIATLKDKIFPLENLKRAWGAKLEIIDGEHFPAQIFEDGFSRILTRTPAIAKTFGRSFASYDKEAKVQLQIARRLAKLVLKRIDPEEILEILEIGVGTGFLTKELAKKLKGKQWHLNDLSASAADYTKGIVDTIPAFIEGDAQLQEFPKGMDLIVSASCFQWIENLEAFFKKLAASCNIGSMLAFSTFLPENLREIRSLTGRGLNYMGIVGLESIMTKNGFEILCSEAETIKVDFEDPIAVLRHLRETGVGGSFADFWTPQKLKHFSKQYSEFFSNGKGGVTLTYRPIYFVSKFVGEVAEPEE
jgi:malonyl-CoA O-methyltransferase/biotin synthesis protein BioG